MFIIQATGGTHKEGSVPKCLNTLAYYGKGSDSFIAQAQLMKTFFSFVFD
jgi:hypothetical protein